MKTWNFGIIGAGLISDFHAQAIESLPNAKLTGFYDVVSERCKEKADKYGCAAFESCEAMLASDEVEVVTIAIASGAHMEPVIAAAEAGKHVLCEKPLEVTLERIDAMVAAHKASGTLLGGVFQNRFTDAMEPLRGAIEGGRFGRITYCGVYVPWWRTDDYYTDSWHGTWKLDGGGALMNQSIHMIDMLCDLMGPVESVQAFTAKLAHPQIETEDTATAVLRFGCGALGIVYGTTGSYPGSFKRFEITGTGGTVIYLEDSFTTWQFAEELDGDEDVRQRFGSVTSEGGVSDPGAISHENHGRNFASFIDVLKSGGDFAIGGAEARKSVELILAIYESAAEGKIVRLV